MNIFKIDNFKTLINQKVERLFILLWPPEGEERWGDVDLSVGFVFAENPNQLCVVCTDGDRWTPCIRYQALPERWFDWNEFDTRVKGWMDSAEMGDMDTEYYEVTHANIFKGMVSHSVKSIEFAAIKRHYEPFGVKFIFETDYIFLTSTSQGNTFETAYFNQNNNAAVFQTLGTIEYRMLNN